jgi:hypothetical protein
LQPFKDEERRSASGIRRGEIAWTWPVHRVEAALPRGSQSRDGPDAFLRQLIRPCDDFREEIAELL